MLPMLKAKKSTPLKESVFFSFNHLFVFNKKKDYIYNAFLFNFGNIGKMIKRKGMKAFFSADVEKN